jgi:hypothetical protein
MGTADENVPVYEKVVILHADTGIARQIRNP